MDGTVGGATCCRFATLEGVVASLGGTVTMEVTPEGDGGAVVTVDGCAPPTTHHVLGLSPPPIHIVSEAPGNFVRSVVMNFVVGFGTLVLLLLLVVEVEMLVMSFVVCPALELVLEVEMRVTSVVSSATDMGRMAGRRASPDSVVGGMPQKIMQVSPRIVIPWAGAT